VPAGAAQRDAPGPPVTPVAAPAAARRDDPGMSLPSDPPDAPAAADRLAAMFAHFAEHEFRGSSRRYEVLSAALAERPALARPLLAAPPNQRRAILLFAAARYLLRTAAPDHPLATYLLDLAEPDAGLLPAWADLVAHRGAELTSLCATRTTQTNEARRCAVLRPALGRAARLLGAPLGLVELGTSAGLLLLPDRYGYRYTGGGRTGRHGDAPPDLVLECEVRGPGWPPVEPLEVADRVGVDLHPLDPADPAAADWLRACVWPEHVDRLRRLDAALAEAARVRPRLVRGDMVAALPGAVAGVAGVPCVFASNAVCYLDDPRPLAAELARIGAGRDLAVVLNETAQSSVRLFAADAPPPSRALSVGTLTLVVWRDGRPTVHVLGRTGAHGGWLSWDPVEYAYAA
jgi:hypothetical protein